MPVASCTDTLNKQGNVLVDHLMKQLYGVEYDKDGRIVRMMMCPPPPPPPHVHKQMHYSDVHIHTTGVGLYTMHYMLSQIFSFTSLLYILLGILGENQQSASA